MPSNCDLTDMDGDTVRFTHPHGGHTFVTVQSTSGTACAGPFTRAQLIEALDAVAPAGNASGPHVHHEAQGGWKRRDDYPAGGLVQALPADAAEARPLTPDAITDESVERAQSELLDTAGLYVSRSSLRDVLTAALTEPPRPEDTAADRLRALLAAYDGQDPDADDYEGRLSVYLARHGARVEEDPR